MNKVDFNMAVKRLIYFYLYMEKTPDSELQRNIIKGEKLEYEVNETSNECELSTLTDN